MKNEYKKIIKKAIVVADPNELNLLNLENWVVCDTLEYRTKKVYILEKDKQKIALIHSGIGLANAAETVAFVAAFFENIEGIYNYGAVGANSDNLEVYDVVAPEKFFLADAKTPWYPEGQTPGEKLFYQNNKALNYLNNNIKKTNIVSSNSFFANKEIADYYGNIFNTEIFDMEASSFSHICDKYNIDFYCIKAISDIIGKDSPEMENINQRIANAGKLALKSLLEIIEKK
ncbi:phosphorylase family protein [Mycoplasma procyoni]|uniref:phosphorylase family protein n=1 Tax=Mycoplasma procyoni TaxID=568784 RepID=UPI00197C04F6|nr:hypothetical protein [Mycoplasma procyoni]MBN3534541.1 hypothetical protein [Mycoplasma procyoni]